MNDHQLERNETKIAARQKRAKIRQGQMWCDSHCQRKDADKRLLGQSAFELAEGEDASKVGSESQMQRKENRRCEERRDYYD